MAHEQLVVYIVEKAKNYFVKVFYIDLFVKIWFDGNLLTTLFGQNFRENDVFTKEITE